MLLAIKDISKTYSNGKQALKDVSFSISKGEFVSVIGPSGAGKSTLLRSINQLVSPDKGEVLFNGTDLMKSNKKKLRQNRCKIGMIFQHYNLVSRLTAVENVLHGRLGYKSSLSGSLGHYTEAEKKKAFSLLKRVGLDEFAYTRCDELSGGQKQRVGIARALMQEPELILCDEPIASLDPKSSKVVMDYLKKVTAEMGITCLVNLHQVEVAISYSDRIIGVTDGRIVFDDLPRNLDSEMINEIYLSKELLV
ncbi:MULTISPECIES: phosphonate ABC transporter ATP-binding protein [Enterococcus]|uniref:Phosphonate ABC transporter ATP-binding protein n=1 Tax=Candidatus Enterococcus murrayae TaxID=2815321 RepID=A0ABS3HJ65_9ENTE|nr:phosphonate ABC transporter ATP-binding protein [Enterococcus sp. MJM16]MBO0453504.1 phosphonate ABC transporter ATP-binding protein [Enterococcus sp. MJM16]